MASCVVKNCINHEPRSSEDNITNDILYHTFPDDPELKDRWLKEINQEGFEPTAESVICSLHFNREFFVTDGVGTTHLKSDAVPTQFEFETIMETDGDDIIRCCAAKCTNVYQENSPISFHPFPVEQPDLCDQWLIAMNVTQLAADTAVLCSEHFDESCFITGVDGQRLIMADAVPAIFASSDGPDESNAGIADKPDEGTAEDATENGVAFTEAHMDLVEKHDAVVTEMNEASAKLLDLVQERTQLEKTKKELDGLLRVVVGGIKLDKNVVKGLTTIIRSVDELAQQVVVDCLAPCVALPQELQPIQE